VTEDEGKTFQRVLSVAQTLLQADRETGAVTPALILEQVEVAAMVVARGAEIDKQAAVAELIRRFSLWIGKDSTLADNEGHKAWLTAARSKDWPYWQRYQSMLETKMSVKAVDALDESTDHILGLLEDPKREGRWDRRGLVVGHVQSGKTGNYTGLVCKAADAGYKIVIVLAGLHNNLRSQTQIRLEEGFLGYETSAKGDSVRVIGVGEFDSDTEIRPNCATNRSNNGDFNTKVAQHYAISPEQRPWLFVVKKNKTVLESLLKWIRNHVADSKDADGRPLVTNLPLLLIDDEADHASVDTGEQLFNPDGTPDDEHQPKAINSRIRKILHAFAKKAYVGYTATPFANIFIHRRGATSEEGPDLFPQSFIVNLAAPSNYVGPARVFGLRSQDGRSGGLPLVREVDDHVDSTGKEGWMPAKHKTDHVPLCSGGTTRFLRRCARPSAPSSSPARPGRSGGRDGSTRPCWSTSRATTPCRRASAGRSRTWSSVSGRGSSADSSATSFSTSGAASGSPISPPPPRPSPRRCPDRSPTARCRPGTTSWPSCRRLSGTSTSGPSTGPRRTHLDYSENEGTGLKVIAIGGDKLARGLTLEGLCVSYFVRTSKMYDTLMQMGSWFGYRPGYIDLCRLYTSGDLVEWFGHIADAAEELRQEFDTMAAVGSTPENYGMKVQSHPVLMVTSPLKMRSAKSLQLSFSGEVLETVAFHRDPEILAKNLAAAERLLDAAGAPAEDGSVVRRRGTSTQEWKGYLWNGVPADLVADFFSSYLTHPAARKVNSALLCDFVRAMAANGELTSWTVVLMGGGEGESHEFCGRHLVEKMIRRKPKEGGGHYSIGRLLSPRDEAIDLDEAAWTAAMDVTLAAWTKDPARQSEPEKPEAPENPGRAGHPERPRLRGAGRPRGARTRASPDLPA
jgi:hypothetical protein